MAVVSLQNLITQTFKLLRNTHKIKFTKKLGQQDEPQTLDSPDMAIPMALSSSPAMLLSFSISRSSSSSSSFQQSSCSSLSLSQVSGLRIGSRCKGSSYGCFGKFSGLRGVSLLPRIDGRRRVAAPASRQGGVVVVAEDKPDVLGGNLTLVFYESDMLLNFCKLLFREMAPPSSTMYELELGRFPIWLFSCICSLAAYVLLVFF